MTNKLDYRTHKISVTDLLTEDELETIIAGILRTVKHTISEGALMKRIDKAATEFLENKDLKPRLAKTAISLFGPADGLLWLKRICEDQPA